jgi:hypothetical protein
VIGAYLALCHLKSTLIHVETKHLMHPMGAEVELPSPPPGGAGSKQSGVGRGVLYPGVEAMGLKLAVDLVTSAN